MKTYIVNLARSTDRKEYMERQLEKFTFLSPEFVEAVDGRLMDDDERDKKFNGERFSKRYARNVRPGEIGCTLSHQRCYEKLIKEGENCALILEDDAILEGIDAELFKQIEYTISVEEPRILLLSGWFWYYRVRSFFRHYKLANIYDAFLTHAYVINHAAALLLKEERPYIAADDWRYVRHKGVKVQGFLPHILDQQQEDFQSLIQPSQGIKLDGGMIFSKIKVYVHAAWLYILQYLGKFEEGVKRR